MRMVAVFAMMLVGCDAASSEYPAVIEARSAAAEWARVNELAAERLVTRTYAQTMREAARHELETAASSFSDPGSLQAAEVKALLELPPDAAPSQLRHHVEALRKIEERLAVS